MSLLVFSIPLIIISIINQGESLVRSCQSSCDVYLSQDDFESGTYRITNSGTYCIRENIKFNPIPGKCLDPNTKGAWFPNNNIAFPGSTRQAHGPFALGFFAAITIETSDVVIDLCGNQMEYDFSFYLQQRWGSIIEIGNQPFLPKFGPADFGPKAETINNVVIKNGEFGLTSHHAIHSNQATNVVIKDLQIKDFEVGAIQLNGFNGALIENIKIGPSFKKVPLTAFYSNARFILLAYRSLLSAFFKNGEKIPSITFNGDRTLTLVEITQNLVMSLDLVFGVLSKCLKECDVKNNPLYKAGKKLFINEEQLPDGSAIYGIVLNSKSVAVNAFGESENTETGHGQNATIRNVDIRDLFLNVNEIPAVFFDKCDDANAEKKSIQKGPFGDVFDLRETLDERDFDLIEQHGTDPDSLANIEYKGNPLSDAQIALGIYGNYLGEGSNYDFGGFIADELADWARGIAPFPSQCADFVCNGDIMFHVNKGAVALRMDGIENSIIENIRIKNVVNRSPLVSNACGAYDGPHDGGTSGTREKEGGMGTDIRGICIAGGDVTIIGNKNKIKKLNSFYGDVTGFDILDGVVEFDVGSDIEIKDIKSASKLTKDEYETLVELNKTPYPNNFDLCTIKIEEGSQVIGDVPEDLDETECIEGTYDNKFGKGGKSKKSEAMQINLPFVDNINENYGMDNEYYGLTRLQFILLNCGVSVVVCLLVIAFCLTGYYCCLKWNIQTYSFKKIVEEEDENME